ncbi:hypothetical protein CTI14_61860, partial [Methylobacterium radiotolerans]
SSDAFLVWGWRVAFWLSAIVVIVGYVIRTKIDEAPIFQAAKAELETEKAAGYGASRLLKRYPRVLRRVPRVGLARGLLALRHRGDRGLRHPHQDRR